MDMTSLNISLPGALKKFAEAEARSGGYSTSSEYIRDLLRQAQKRKAQEELEAKLIEGLHSGESIEMTEADWQDIRKELRARVAKKNGEA